MKFWIAFLPFLLFASPNLWLLERYKDQNLSGWVMSEKLDGIRAYWDGKQLLSRNGKPFSPPSWFTQNYPPFPIDGELWSKRGDFEHIASIVQDQTPSEQWREIKHYIFEVPYAKGNLSMRLAILKPYQNDVIHIIPQIPIQNHAHLQTFFKEIESKGGEGVVVRDPTQPYIDKRTNTALKVKSFDDTECNLTGYTQGKGKYTGMVGALQCVLSSKITFKIGSGLTDALRKNPPPIGSSITFKHQGFTKYGKPRFPVFLRVRKE